MPLILLAVLIDKVNCGVNGPPNGMTLSGKAPPEFRGLVLFRDCDIKQIFAH
jgi:hypothetical protein